MKNLENLKIEMRDLGFGEQLIERMEQHMEANEPRFILYDELKSDKGRMELALHFNQSKSSEYYYFNKFDLVLEKQPPLAEGKKYFVCSQRQGEDPSVREFGMPSLAVKDFNWCLERSEQIRGAAQIFVGSELASSRQLASMVDGKVLEVEKDFYKCLMDPAPGHTFYIEKGNGFALEQALNLVSGRSVYREDMLNIHRNEYTAWAKLDFDGDRERNGNFPMKTFTQAYGYDLSAVLDRFDFKELGKPELREALELSLRNGNRAEVTVQLDGKPAKVLVEAVPEFKQLNIYALDGRSIKREDHLRLEEQAELGLDKGKSVKKGKEQDQGLSV